MKKILCVAVAILMISSMFLLSACNLVSGNNNGEVVTDQQGEAGEKGEQGGKGDQSDKGEQGENGNQGNQGNQGDQGNQGNQGDTTSSNNPIDFSLLPDGTYGVMAGKLQNLEDIEIPAIYNDKAVTSILPNAFQNAESLKSITIPDSVTNIGKNAFNSCTSLTEITIGNGVATIGVNAFEGCTSLSGIYIQDIAKWCKIDFYNYESNPLYNNASLYLNGTLVTELVIPETVTRISARAFYNCTSLTSITIPSSVTHIEYAAFAACGKLVEVINHSDLSLDIGSYSNGDVAYSAIEIHNGASKIVNKDGYLFYTYDGVNYLLGYAGTDTALTLPRDYNGETYELYDLAFYYCDSLTSVAISNGVTKIGELVFAYCKNLTSITIPNSVTSIGELAFTDCENLTSITIPDSVTSIGFQAFFNCTYLASLTIGNGVTSIGSYAFWQCYSLTEITIPDSVTNIGEYAFSNCDSLTSVTIGSGVTSIGSYAFRYCTRLTSVTFENPNGWSADGTSISSSALAYKSFAAQYLTDTYRSYNWQRS